jgi:hypothetical protein
MTKLNFEQYSYLPANMAGKWRASITAFYEEDGEIKTECVCFMVDLFYKFTKSK